MTLVSTGTPYLQVRTYEKTGWNMDAFIGTMVMLFVFAFVSGLFVAAGVLGNMKYDHRHAGISLLYLGVMQAVAIIAMIAHPASRNIDDSISEMVQLLFWIMLNLAVGCGLIVRSLHQPQKRRLAPAAATADLS